MEMFTGVHGRLYSECRNVLIFPSPRRGPHLSLAEAAAGGLLFEGFESVIWWEQICKVSAETAYWFWGSWCLPFSHA